MKRWIIKDVLVTNEYGSDITVAGWVRTRRDSKGGFSFIEINDGSIFANLQIIAGDDLENYNKDICNLFPGSSISVTGTVVKSEGKGQSVELQAKKIKVLGFCDPMEYPLGKQRVSLEHLREIAHLRPRTNTFGAVARVRNALAYGTHKFFQDKNFNYIHTPILTASDCEGAGEMFRVSTLDPENLPRLENGEVDFAQDFFAEKTSLTVSGQLEGETYACALGNIYTFGPTFRAENSNTRRHLAEFWMIEPEMAFADLADDANLAEEYLCYLFNYILTNCDDDLTFFDQRIEKGLKTNLANLASHKFIRISYTDAIDILQKSNQKFDFKPEWGSDLQSEHERFLTEKEFNSPVIVLDYPKSIKPFYMRQNDDGKTVAAMDVLLPKVGEIIGGSQREDREELLNERITEQGFNAEDYWWYCDLRKFGSVPHAGFGLGFERIVQFCTGMQNIRDVIPFPRTPKSIDF